MGVGLPNVTVAVDVATELSSLLARGALRLRALTFHARYGETRRSWSPANNRDQRRRAPPLARCGLEDSLLAPWIVDHNAAK
jgi:hypothetical protein